VRCPLRILLAALASLLVASTDACAHAWYPLAYCGGEDCGPADIVVYAEKSDWDQQLRAFETRPVAAMRSNSESWRRH
jgi:hypothetical protein